MSNTNVVLTPNPTVVQIPTPLANVGALVVAVQALKRDVDSLSGNTGALIDRAVTFQDLINLGLISLV